MLNILILAAGAPTPGTATPLCLAELGGQMLLERIFENCAALQPSRIIIALGAEEARKHHLESVVKLLEPTAEVMLVKPTAGAACTALLAAAHIDNADELLVLSANEWVSASYKDAVSQFKAQDLAAGVLSFKSVHPRYASVRVEDGLVTEAAEKRPLSTHACAGFYWFAQGSDFVQAAKAMLRKDARTNGLFYVAPALNELVLAQKRVGIVDLDPQHYHPLKTPAHLDTQAHLAEMGRV